MTRGFHLRRRTVLRGLAGAAAVTIALPVLEAMLDDHGDAFADGTSSPRRFVSWMYGNGCLLDRFEPEEIGASWTLSDELAPLAPVKDYVTVCTGFANRCALSSGFFAGHYEGLTAFSGFSHSLRPPSFYYDAGGPTLDQVVADRIAASTPTPVRSLQVGVSKSLTLAGIGPLGGSISFRGEPDSVTALPPVTNPQQIWQSLFGTIPDATFDDRPLRSLVLDGVRAQSDKLHARLGSADRQRLEAHLEGVGELQQKLAAAAPACARPDVPTEANAEPIGAESLTAVNTVMAELIAYALACDLTRVASCMFLGMAGETPFTEAGLSAPHHLSSHEAQFDPAARASYHTGVVYEMAQLATLLQVLRDTVDPLGNNLLDSTIVYAASDCSVGWMHSIARMPVILAGTGGGHLVHPGIHVQAIANDPRDPNGVETAALPTDGNLSDILLSCLQAFDPAATEVGGGQPHSTTPLAAILA
jgi:hypothetical protein